MSLLALARAQLQDVSRNPMLLVFWGLLPAIGFAMKASMPEGTHTFLAVMMSVMSAYFVGWNLPAHTLAEEKEKRQLAALFLTPIRPWQAVLVKGLLALLLSAVFGLFSMLIVGRLPAHPQLWLVSYLVLSLFTIAGGTLIGLLVKDMRTLGAGGTPVLLLLIFATTLPWGTVQPTFWAVQAWLPTRPAVELLQTSIVGQEAPIVRNLIVMLGYTALLWAVNVRLIRRMAFAEQ